MAGMGTGCTQEVWNLSTATRGCGRYDDVWGMTQSRHTLPSLYNCEFEEVGINVCSQKISQGKANLKKKYEHNLRS